MPQYAFYPEKIDGSPASLEVFELCSDVQAFVRAEHVLAEHRTSRSVAVWLDDRMVLTLFRRDPQHAAAPRTARRAEPEIA